YVFPTIGTKHLEHPPVIVGSGPAGLFCGLMLAEAGYRPILLERGESVDLRTQKVHDFWSGGALDLNSNVQFGEGGAGTFSDGKLNTLVKDPLKRNQKVLEILVEHGADPSVLYLNKPHIGTDVLSNIVKQIREHIIRLGGEVRFSSQVTDLLLDGKVTGVMINGTELLKTEALILAIGHSARDTFEMLYQKEIPMQQKAFAVGLRIQHPQKMINQSQYGVEELELCGPASYKLTKQTTSGRGVYSFCMCPGGYVVNASSENKCLAVNGMSNHDRGGINANSALIVTVTPDDFSGTSPLAGVEYQRKLEALAYEYGGGHIPVQLYGDFKVGKQSTSFGEIQPEFKGGFQFANLSTMLPSYLTEALIEGMESFEHSIPGFARQDSILAGIESRTSSPVRIERNEAFESAQKGLFPCGEGAGYAGGITSAAMDGMKVAEEIGRRYLSLR
ncbi:MAG: FAD-binding protein, partial [Hungatella sp.]